MPRTELQDMPWLEMANVVQPSRVANTTKPSSKLSSVSWAAGTVKCWTWPGRSQNRRSMNS